MNKVHKILKGTRVSYSSSGYILYHKTFSTAIQHSLDIANSKGFIVSPETIDNYIALADKKPTCNKTNRYILPTNKKAFLHVQIANLDDKRYELNMYID